MSTQAMGVRVPAHNPTLFQRPEFDVRDPLDGKRIVKYWGHHQVAAW